MRVKTVQSGLAVYPLVNLYSIWQNIIVSTQAEEALIAERIPTNHKHVYYMYDLDWHDNDISYEKNIELMRDVDFLLCRCEDHATKIADFCGRTPVVCDLTYENIKEQINGKE
jgi:hypothetical protein